MNRFARASALLLLALAGAAAAHVLAYASVYGCWMCLAGDVDPAAHGSAGLSVASAIAIGAFAAALAGRRLAKDAAFSISAPQLLGIQAPIFLGFELLERNLSIGSTFADHAVLLGLLLQIVTAVIVARLTRAVVVMVRALRQGRIPRTTHRPEAARTPRLGVRSRATVWNSRGFLRAPPPIVV
ncbi:MAG: hypothetical protein WD096_10465 [Actinomycetota bacterium]